MAGSSRTRLLGALQEEVAGGAVSGAFAFTTGGIQFAGVGVETITGAAAFTTGSITFSGVGVETEIGSLAFTTGSISFAGIGAETESGTLAFTTDSIQFAGVGSVATADASGTLGFATDSIGFSGSGEINEELVEIPQGQGNWYKTKPKFRIKLVKQLTREIEEVRAKKDDAVGLKHAELVIYEALLHEKLVEQFDESLKNLVTEIEYKKTEKILNEIKLSMENKKLMLQLEEEEIMFAIMSLL